MMNRIKLVLISFLLMNSMYAQYTVKVKVTVLPEKHMEDAFFITGNFNNWKVAEPELQMQKVGDSTFEITVKATKGLFEYKFNRGDWKKLECTPEGKLADPHKAIITKDTTLSTTIHGWRDDYPASTASAQVHLLDSAFFMPQLNRYRTIWIYLPKGYETSNKKYPVLYMHDGQGLFDEATSQGRTGPVEWAVDETIDTASNPCIVVGINHDKDFKVRAREYYVEPNPDYDTVYGKAYLQFIVKTLKPFIDQKYRTLSDKKHTYMSGSSMGGLITLYAGLMYPDVFGSLGVLSPSVWLDYDNNYKLIKGLTPVKLHNQQRYYFYAGGNENRLKPDSSFVKMHDDVTKTIAAIKTKISPEIELAINPEGRHGPWYWSLAFPAFFEWLTNKK